MPQGLKEALEQSAKENNRSLTAEIIARLQQSLALKKAVPIADPVAQEAMLKNVQKILEEREDELFRSMEQKLEQLMAPYRVTKTEKD